MSDIKKRDLLCERRKRALLTQLELASRLGISQTQFSLVERGYTKPDAELAEQLTKMFDLPENYFDQ